MTDLTRDADIRNTKGLHARAAAKFCKTAGQFNADVRVSKGGPEVSGSSIMGLMMLGAALGDHITISASGDGAEQAVATLAELVEARFHEAE